MEEVATLGGGCFWCLDTIFRRLEGVNRVESGYAGGHMLNPSYQAVCSGETGHAEVIRVWFDSTKISFSALLEVFFAIHDPTTPNRQGYDVGSQYRSVVFYHSDEQESVVTDTIKSLTERQVFNAPIVTEVEKASNYYPAEDYHQDYFENNPRQPYCQAVVSPKLAKFKGKFASQLKND